MKIALAQINPVIGDFSKNCGKVIEQAKRAHQQGCGMVVFSEMVISGYPPQDLLERRSFQIDHDNALENMCKELPPIDIVLGCIETNQLDIGKSLYNSAFVIRENKIIQRIRKQLLPSYDVFDEKRYFAQGSPSDLYTIGGYNFGVTICEDIWHEEVGEYSIDPISHLVNKASQSRTNLSGIINISASPFEREKGRVRKKIFESLCLKHNVPLIYVNQVGGQDSIVFDGASMVVNSDGNICSKLKSFEEDFKVVDFDEVITSRGQKEDTDLTEDESVYEALVLGTRDYVRKCGFKSVVLGLSGGIDSALTATIAVDALGPDNVLGIALPSPYSSLESLADAKALAGNLGCKYEVIPISELLQNYKDTLRPLCGDFEHDLTEQNIQARIRGNLLMSISNMFGHLLLTTGNKSEMAVGYCTLYGDMSGGLAVISDVPKQLVYKLSHLVNNERVRIPVNTITKPPSAELKPDQKDQDDLPDYDVLDQVLQHYLVEGKGRKEIVSLGFDAVVVEDITRRIRINEYKRKQAPIGLKVTSKAFGYGRRYPNVQNYRG